MFNDRNLKGNTYNKESFRLAQYNLPCAIQAFWPDTSECFITTSRSTMNSSISSSSSSNSFSNINTTTSIIINNSSSNNNSSNNSNNNSSSSSNNSCILFVKSRPANLEEILSIKDYCSLLHKFPIYRTTVI